MKVFVTGGSGFLGGRIVRAITQRGWSVHSLQRNPLADDSPNTLHVAGDVSRFEDVLRAAEGCDAIVHTAAKAAVWGPPTEFHRINVTGTANVIVAAQRLGIRHLVHTSTPSVVHGGSDVCAVGEDAPYAEHFLAEYPRTKARAERMVLEAAGRELRCVALRPHLLWGPGDPHLVPRILARAKRGTLALPGGGHKLVDATFIDNAADAHLCALDRLIEDDACSGKAYFIANGEPRPLRDIVSGIVTAAGMRARVRSVPVPFVRVMGAGLEAAFGLLRSTREPPLTRFVAAQLSTAHHFDLSAAKRDLRWSPRISTSEGLALLAASLRG